MPRILPLSTEWVAKHPFIVPANEMYLRVNVCVYLANINVETFLNLDRENLLCQKSF